MACRGDPPITSWRASASTTLRNPRRHRGAQASLIMHLHSRRVLFTYNVLIAHLVSQHALISLYYCWDHLACPQSWAHPWAHPWAHLYARNTTRPPRVLKSAQSRALDLSDRHRQVWIAGLILKIPPDRSPRSHRSWDPGAGQLSRWASRSCMVLHIASVTSFVPIHKVGILQIPKWHS